MAPSLYNTINAAFKKLYRRFQRLEQRVKRIEERLDIESMSSSLEMLDVNDLPTHVTQDQDDHHDSSSSSSSDEDVIRPEKPASQRVPQSETEVPDKGKGKEKERYTKLLHTNILARDSQFCRPAKPKKLEVKTTPAAVETSRPSELNGSRTSAARSLGLDILPVNMDDADRNPSPYSKAKRGKRSHEDDGSPAKPAWLSQKRSNGRFSKRTETERNDEQKG
ncbi:hypothetical protein D6C92_09259 [Aureobasidium pullulans]|uniref:Uncharacterized protein n=1 Tax=Aureobasidium pullulans TaxID=5580 RepID=A0A4S9QIW4_AURPU|nr:hypothetical protein D6D22_00454 [Aureobasidium pullulans]THY84509.1 hypothetical protein D6C92_09259 [Aureobasidium pullulans]